MKSTCSTPFDSPTRGGTQKAIKSFAAILIGVVSSVSGYATPRPSTVFISEFLAANRTGLDDEDGDSSDWIEICNASPRSVPLAGWSLTDDPGDVRKWVFPAVTIEPGEYIVIFASDKNRAEADGSELHTNFKIRGRGEYLALFDDAVPAQVITEFNPEFPLQRADVSYGSVGPADGYRYFDPPTPGTPNNTAAFEGFLPDVTFSVEHGFYENPFDVILGVSAPTAEIRYTTDGSTPTATHGVVYEVPVQVAETTTLRARAFRSGFLPSAVGTMTYLMNLQPVLKSLPALSLVTDENNLTGPTGIVGMSDQSRLKPHENTGCSRWRPEDNPPPAYYNPSNRGREWERPVSVEYIDPVDNSGFQADAGIRVHGSDHTRPRLCVDSKFSYKLYFRDEYGEDMLVYPIIPISDLDQHKRIVVRAGLDDRINPFIRDELARRLWADMGYVSVRGTFVHVFVNGDYQGYYNPCERPDEEFLQAWFGTSSSWDVVKRRNDITDGDDVAWQALLAEAPEGRIPTESRYDQIEPLLDVVNFIDYLILNIYAATWDWPQNNWVMIRERVPGAKIRFMVWDAEGAFGYDSHTVNYPTIVRDLFAVAANDNEIPRVFRALVGDERFKQLFQERVKQHMYGDGALTDENIRFRYEELAAIMEPVIPNFDRLPNRDFPDLDDDFSIGSTWIPGRRAQMLRQLEPFDLAPSAPPLFLPGDCNQDARLDISDCVCLLEHLFGNEPSRLACGDGNVDDPANVHMFDSNGDGGVDVSDAVRILGYLFLRGSPHVSGTECVAADGCPGVCTP